VVLFSPDAHFQFSVVMVEALDFALNSAVVKAVVNLESGGTATTAAALSL